MEQCSSTLVRTSNVHGAPRSGPCIPRRTRASSPAESPASRKTKEGRSTDTSAAMARPSRPLQWLMPGPRSLPSVRRYRGSMKAAVHSRYGPPDVVRVMEIDRPAPKDGELLVRVHATTVNRTDCAYRAARPFFMRFVSGLRRPRATVLGNEFAGEVEAVAAASPRSRSATGCSDTTRAPLVRMPST